METKYFSLGASETNTIIKIIRILFGLVCIAIAVFWIIFNIRAAGAERSVWITVVFLSGFGLYQIWAGLGRAERFIRIASDRIILKKNSFLPVKEISGAELKKIEVYPLNLIFYFHNEGKTILRFGTTFTDNIDPVKNEIEKFASLNKIEIETIREEI
ncbi:MAG: hypothetical protein IPN67_08875 [Bacteroidales bacterium]|nr:hypothetical protein [Bacteroidales bacterium]